MIVNVVVNISIFLFLNPVFASDLHSTRRATDESAVCLRFGFVFVSRTTFSFHHFLHLVKKFLCHYWLVLAFVYFSRVSEVSVIKLIGGDKGGMIFMDSLSVFCKEII